MKDKLLNSLRSTEKDLSASIKKTFFSVHRISFIKAATNQEHSIFEKLVPPKF